jgi:ArsR family transcriptional regulator
MSSILRMYKALANESRLRILKVLTLGRYNVNELVNILGMGQSRISRHLKLLLDAGLAEVRREGTWAYYEAAQNKDKHIQSQIRWIAQKATGIVGVKQDEIRRQKCLQLRRQKSKDFHDKAAPGWSRLRRELVGDGAITKHIQNFLKGASSIADLGCGDGEMLVRLAQDSERIIGVDASPAMLEQARLRLARQPEHICSNVQLRLGQLEHLPLADSEVQAALLNMVVHHLAEPQAAFREVLRVLSPGGTLLLCELNQHNEEWLRDSHGDQWLGFSKQELERMVAQAGFSLHETKLYTNSPRTGIVLLSARA